MDRNGRNELYGLDPLTVSWEGITGWQPGLPRCAEKRTLAFSCKFREKRRSQSYLWTF
jgi:hypothetical protein